MSYGNGDTPIEQAEELEELARREAAGQSSPPMRRHRPCANGGLPAMHRTVDEVPLGDSEAL